jgi:very-short-patch-repair endonuclease
VRGNNLSNMEQILQARARILRKNSTEAENQLWYFLRKRNFNNFKFRRQYVIDQYIVDFICIRKKLIIELDGGQHATDICYDERRTALLKSKGYTVLRFWNNEVFTEIEGVLGTILDKLKSTDFVK